MLITHNQDEFQKFGRTIRPEADPTRSTGARDRFAAEVGRRYVELAAVITRSIVINDCFGLHLRNELEPLPPGALAALPPDRQVEEFLEWLDTQIAAGVLELTPAPGGGTQPWVHPHLSASMAKGVQRGSADLRALGAPVVPVTTETIAGVMALPPMESALNLEVMRTWRGLSGVAQQTTTQVAAVLADGLETGAAPLELARNINDRVDKIGRTRSELIARTEIVRANNLGSVAEYARAEQAIGEPVLVQWQATLDNRVRDNHILRHGKVFERDEALQLIGEPNCRCALLPFIESIEGEGDGGTAAEFIELDPGTAETDANRIRREEGLRVTDE